MALIYTFVNQKGGVGKTTSAINLGAYLGALDQRVLLVDIDPQANATSCLGIDKHTIRDGIYKVLIGQIPVASQILHNPKLKLSLLPSSPALAGAEVELVDIPMREMRLREVIKTVSERYDYILIDCPPSLSVLTVNGLAAALDGVIIPVQCEYLALEGLGLLTKTLDRVKSSLFPQLSIRGVLLTMYDNRTKLSNDVIAEVRQFFPDKVFHTMIPRNIRLAEAPSYGLPISLYAPESTGGKAYQALANEVLTNDRVSLPKLEEKVSA